MTSFVYHDWCKCLHQNNLTQLCTCCSKGHVFHMIITAASHEHYGISYYQQLNCFFKNLVRLTAMNISKICFSLWGNPLAIGGLTSQRASNVVSVSKSWQHHVTMYWSIKLYWNVIVTSTYRAGTSNYIPQYLWDVIICPCLWYLFLSLPPEHITNQTDLWIDYSLWHVKLCWDMLLVHSDNPVKNWVRTQNKTEV